MIDFVCYAGHEFLTNSQSETYCPSCGKKAQQKQKQINQTIHEYKTCECGKRIGYESKYCKSCWGKKKGELQQLGIQKIRSKERNYSINGKGSLDQIIQNYETRIKIGKKNILNYENKIKQYQKLKKERPEQ